MRYPGIAFAWIALAMPAAAQNADSKSRGADLEFLWKTLNDQVPADLMKVKGIGRKTFLKLHAYKGPQHPHSAQKPEPTLIYTRTKVAEAGA